LGWADRQQLNLGDLKTRSSKLVRFASVLGLVVWAVGPRASAQTPPVLDFQTYAGLTITGAVGTVYSVEYVTDLTQTNTPSTWRCLEFLQLPARPYLWAGKSAQVTGKRFYRAVTFGAATNMVFIPPGTFQMGSPTNEVDRNAWEGPQTAVTISRGFWMGKYEVTQGEYQAVRKESLHHPRSQGANDLRRRVPGAGDAAR
jgi:formylglycine-generating enzyme required for sulfatase activity